MFYFAVTVVAILSLSCANPVPNESNESNGSNLNLNTVELSSNYVLIGDNLADSNYSPDPVIVANSIAGNEPECTSDALIHDDVDNNLQKRVNACPIDGDPKVPTQPSSHQSPDEVKKSTSTSGDPCRRSARPRYVSCGGAEIKHLGDEFYTLVLNCVPGIFFNHFFIYEANILPAAVSKYIPPRPPMWGATDILAEYCCEMFIDKVSVL